MDWQSILSLAFLSQLIAATIRLATPLVIAALGEMFCERVGVLNLGVEGIMLLSGLGSFVLAFYSDSLWFGMLSGVIAGALIGLLFALLTVTFRTNQMVTGLTFLILCSGVAIYIHRLVFGITIIMPRVKPIETLPIPVLSEIPYIGQSFFNHTPYTYFMIVIVLISVIFLYRTPFGLRMSAVGESPQTADTLGINVTFVRYAGIILSGALAGLAGSFFPLAQLGIYSDTMIGGRGFIALALVVFGRWDPSSILVGGLLFGGIDALQSRLQFYGFPISSHFLIMTPYLLTVIILLVGQKRHAPAALTHPYVRE